MIARVFRHSGVYVVAVAFQRGLPLVLLPFVASEVSGAGIGAIGLGVLLAGAVSLVATLGLNVAAIRYRAKDSGVSPQSWSSLFVTQIVWSLLVGIVSLVVVTTWVTGGPFESGQGILQGAVALGVAQSWLQMATAAYRARQMPGGYLAVTVGVFVISLPVAVYLTHTVGIAGYLWGLAIGAALPAIVGIGLSIRRPTFDRKFLVVALSLAAPFMIHWGATWVLMGFDRFLIDRSLGLAAVGVFYLAFVYASVPLLVAESFGTAWLPAYLSEDVDDRTLRHLTGSVSLGVAGLVLVGLGGAVVVLPLMYADLDPAVLPLMAILAPIAVLRVPYIVATAPIVRAHRTSILGISSGGAAVLNVIVVLAVVGTAGLEGVAWAKVLAFALASLTVWLVVLPRAAWPVGVISVVTGATLSWVSVVLILPVAQNGRAVPVAVVVAGAGVVAIAVAFRSLGARHLVSDMQD